MKKIIIIAAFIEENILNECGGHTRLLLCEEQIFYCGTNEDNALNVFNKLPNDDKKIFNANLDLIKIKGV
ncbi:hypothetical protein DVW02_15750 [Clostridium botulinum]|nr:hypothetical protein [Clostridium botulinum]